MNIQKDSSETAFSFMDPSGKLMIKAQLGDDIRMLPLFNEDITYDELILMMQRVFKGKLNNTDDVTLKYKDEDGDLITISDTSDLNLAKQRYRLLKITIFIKGKEVLPLVDASTVKDVRSELTLIRDKINGLLEVLDITTKVPSAQPSSEQPQQLSTGGQQTQTETTFPPVSKAVTSFFDPLKSAPQTPVATETSTAITTANQQTPLSSYASSPASSLIGAPPSQQQYSSNSASTSSSTSHLFGQQQGAPFLPQQQQQQQQQQQPASLPTGNASTYSQQQQQPASLQSSYAQQQPQSDNTSYQMPTAYAGQTTGYGVATANVAPPTGAASQQVSAAYPQQQQQQYQVPTNASGTYPQAYSRYPATATPPQTGPVSSQAYSIYGRQQYQY